MRTSRTSTTCCSLSGFRAVCRPLIPHRPTTTDRISDFSLVVLLIYYTYFQIKLIFDVLHSKRLDSNSSGNRVLLIFREQRRDNESDIHSLPAGRISWLNTNLSVGWWRVALLLDEHYFQMFWGCLSETSKSPSWQEENKIESCLLPNTEVVFILKFLSVPALQRSKAETQHSSLNLFSCIIHSFFNVCKCLLGAFVYKTQTTLSPLIFGYFCWNKIKDFI